MFCKKCGKEIDDNVRFCAYCGELVQAEAEDNEVVDEQHAIQSEEVDITLDSVAPEAQVEMPTTVDFSGNNQEKPRSHKGIIIAAAIIVVIIAIGVAIGVMINRETIGEIGDISFELDKAWELQEKGSSEEVLIYTNKETDDIICEVDLIKKDIVNWQITFEDTVTKMNANGSPTADITSVAGKNAVKYTYNFANDGNIISEVNVHFSYNNQLYVLRVYTSGDGATLKDEMQKLTETIEFTKEKKEAKGDQNYEGMYYSELSSNWVKGKNANGVYYVPLDSDSNKTYGIYLSKQTASVANNTIQQMMESNSLASYNLFVGDKVATLYSTTKAYSGGICINQLVIPDGGNALCIMLATTADGAYEDDFLQLLGTIEF